MHSACRCAVELRQRSTFMFTLKLYVNYNSFHVVVQQNNNTETIKMDFETYNTLFATYL
jgi:hypothetical protein